MGGLSFVGLASLYPLDRRDVRWTHTPSPAHHRLKRPGVEPVLVCHRDLPPTLEIRGTFGLRAVRLGEEPSSIWKAMTGMDARDAPLSADLLGASPEFEASGAYPDEHHGYKEVVRYARHKERERGDHPGRERVAGVVAPEDVLSEPLPEEEERR